MCKAEGREPGTHNLYDCKFLPKADKMSFVSATVSALNLDDSGEEDAQREGGEDFAAVDYDYDDMTNIID